MIHRYVRTAAGHCAAFLALGSLASPGWTQEAPQEAAAGEVTLTVSVPEEGEHLIRLLPSEDAKQPDQLPVRFLDRTTRVTYRPADLGTKARIAVDNAKSGDSAIRPLSGADGPKNGVLDLKSSDFDHVRQLDVSVTFEDKPVAIARVTLKPRQGKERALVLDPSKKGVAIFEDVPMGRARVTVAYGDGFTQSQDVDILSGHAPGPVRISVAVANRVPTVGETSPSAEPEASDADTPREQADASSSAPVRAGGGIAGGLGMILGLAIGAGAIYLLYRWTTSGGLAATLKKAGIEVSGPTAESTEPTPWTPNATPAAVVADPSLCQFCGQPKDAAGNCACSSVPGTGAAPTPTSGGLAQPRLVGAAGAYAGSIFPIEGTATVGREPANAIALPDDSTVSRRHASIRADGDGFVINDEGSSNGVFVNGVRVAGSQPLRPGDEVQIGGTRFRFEV